MLGEDAVYRQKYDDALRTGLRASKPPEDVLDIGKLKEEVEKIQEQFDEENKVYVPEKKPEDDPEQPPPGQDGQPPPGEDGVKETCSKPEEEDNVIKVLDLVDKAKGLKDQDKDCVRAAEVKARRLVDAHVSLVVIPTSEKQAKEIFRTSIANNVHRHHHRPGADG